MVDPLRQPASDRPTLEVRVCGADGEALSESDLRRLFPGSGLTDARLDRLREWSRITVTCGARTVGIATCQKVDTELRVPDVGLDGEPADETLAGNAGVRCGDREILNALLDAIELTCLAGGCSRVILSPPKVSQFFLERRGYRRVDERCAGGWIEKMIE
jgi:hypothetical protein